MIRPTVKSIPWAVAALAGVSAAHAAPTWDSMMAAALNAGGGTVERCIVHYTRPMTPWDIAWLKSDGVVVDELLDQGRTCVAHVRRDHLGSLIEYPDVVSISEDAPLRPNLDTTEHAILASGTPWRGSFRNTMGLDGRGVTVAVLDSGIAAVPGLNNVTRVSFRSDGTAVLARGAARDDAYGHGTHVAGIIGGFLPARTSGVQGIAPGVRLISVPVLGLDGSGRVSDVIAALDACVANKTKWSLDVVNLSLSHPPYESYRTDPLCQAVERAWKAGITVVCSAGNWGRSGYGTIGSPGNDPYVLTVGAMNARKTYTRSDDAVASYSSRGPSTGDHVVKPDILAPGNKVLSWAAPGSLLYNAPGAVHAGQPANGFPPFLQLSGTSMAAPVVAGIAALMKQQNPGASPDQIKARLMATAEKRGEDLFTQGAGYVNVTAALTARSDNGIFTAASPIAEMGTDNSIHLVDPSTGGPVTWNQHITWGAVSGSSAVWGDSALWANSAAWGDSAIWGDSVIWGNSAVWGDTNRAAADAILSGGD